MEKVLLWMAAFAMFGLLPRLLWANVTPAPLFQDSMVLQRDKPLRVWGRAAPGERVKVSLNGKEAACNADEKGKWVVTLPAFEAQSTPQVMVIEGQNKIEVKDVLIGEVFLAGGQSNMHVPVKEALNPQEEIANAKHPLIREFLVVDDWDTSVRDSFQGKWTVVSPKTAGEIGAVGYYFARELQKHLNVPVGIINNAICATPAEAWTPVEVLRAKPKAYARYLSVMDRIYEAGRDSVITQNKAAVQKRQKHRNQNKDRIEHTSNGPCYKDNSPASKETDWTTGPLKGEWKSYDPAGSCPLYGPDISGAFRYRKTVTVPEDFAGKELTLGFTWMVNISVYFNGTRISSTDKGRNYIIPGALVKTGKNILAIRCFQHTPQKDFFERKPVLGKSRQKNLLTGVWDVCAEEILPSIALVMPFPQEMRTGGVLYNAMVAPLSLCVFRGVIWYQGESNQRAISLYAEQFQEMIKAWRKTFANEALPFYFVQLAAYYGVSNNPNAHGGWAALREAQAAALALPNTGMVTALDIGDAKRIHPLNKQEVGRRLAALALNRLFGRTEIPCDCPKMENVSFEGGKITVSFTNAASLKANDGKAIRGFAVFDKPGYNRFRWANAEIEGNKVILTCPDYDVLTAVRYAWASNPGVNLVNENGLPVLAFDMVKK